MKKNTLVKTAAIAGIATAAGLVAKKQVERSAEKKMAIQIPEIPYGHSNKDQVYFIGGGLASMAGAAYLLRDCGFEGKNIHILEGMSILGGSNDGAGNVEHGFVCRGGRMLNEETYENFWELMQGIPSLEMPGKSVAEEILNFDHLHPTKAQARLIDKEGNILDVHSMGFNHDDRTAMGKLLATPEDKLDDMTIQEWFQNTPHFFETNFWFMWQTTFAFQKWSSVFEFRRYMNRMIFEFSRIETLEGVTRTPLNQYESVILPLKMHLDEKGVDFNIKAVVTDIDFKEGEGITVTDLHLNKNGKESVLHLNDNDICIMTNACMTDNATLGDLDTPADYRAAAPISGELWKKIASKKTGLGNPDPFFENPEQTNWESFTVTSKGNRLLKLLEQYSGNIPGSGALMTFKESSWLMSIVVAAQPHFKAQDANTTIFWGYGLFTNNTGDYIKKPMRECTGREMLQELLYHLHMLEHTDAIMEDLINVIPCMMPYVDAQFQPRKMSDRPQVVPAGSTNFAMASQFV